MMRSCFISEAKSLSVRVFTRPGGIMLDFKNLFLGDVRDWGSHSESVGLWTRRKRIASR